MNKYQFLALWSATSIGGGVGGYYYGSSGVVGDELDPVEPEGAWKGWWNTLVKNDYKNNDYSKRRLEYDIGKCSRSFWRLENLWDTRKIKKRRENNISQGWKGCAHIDLRTAELANNSRVLAGRWEIVVKEKDKGVILGGLVTSDYIHWDKLSFRGWRMDMKKNNGWWDLESIKGWIQRFHFAHNQDESIEDEQKKQKKVPTGLGTHSNTDTNKGIIFGKGWVKDSPWESGHDRLVRAYNVCKLRNTDKSDQQTLTPLNNLECPIYEKDPLPFELVRVNNTVFWTAEDDKAESLKDLLKIKIVKGNAADSVNQNILPWTLFQNSDTIDLSEWWDHKTGWRTKSKENESASVNVSDLNKDLGLDKKYKLENLFYKW